MNHKNCKSCNHKNVKYCDSCNMVYCNDCSYEWVQRVVYLDSSPNITSTDSNGTNTTAIYNTCEDGH